MTTDTRPSFRTPSSFVTFRLARLQNSLSAQATALLKSRAGPSLVEWRILQTLRMVEDASPTELAAIVEMDKGQLSRKISAMVAKGLLTMAQDKDDKRVQHLRLTQAAHDLSDRLMPMMEARQDHLLKDVSQEELETFYKVVDRIEAASKARDIP